MAAISRMRVPGRVLALCLLLAAVVSAGSAGAVGVQRASAAPLSSEQVKGDLNGWGSTAWAMTGSLGGTYIYTTGQVTAPSDSSSEFKFFRDSNQWYSNGSGVTFGVIFSGMTTTTSPNMSFNHTQNKYYVFKWNGSDKGVLFQLSAAPVTITGVSRAPTTPTSSESATVTATTSGTPPAEQKLWLRYTTNNWSSSTVVKMAGSGTSYSATILAQANGTTVTYYVFSSGDVASISGDNADLMTINADNNGGSNYSYTVGAANPIGDAQALWLNTGAIAWAGTAGDSYKLLYDADGAVDTAAAAATACGFPSPAGPCHVALTASGTVGAVDGFWKNPNATDKIKLLTGLSAENAKHLLKGQTVVAAYNSGSQVDVSRTQIQSVLDDLYVDNGTADDAVLGVTYSGDIPTARVWAPTAKSVKLRRYADSTTATYTEHTLSLDTTSGVWSVTGAADWDRDFYLFDVEVYAPSADAVVHNLVSDPYAISLSADTADAADPRSQFVNLADADLKPADWDTFTKPAVANPEDIVIYETHIRDFSINDASVTDSAHRGTYLAFTYDGRDDADDRARSNGMDHLQKLQQAGLTHIHLLPTFDIASVPENSVPRSVDPSPAGGRDSQDQQAAVGAGRATDGFNWGYDPHHYGAPEGSYATDANGAGRVREFREMVKALGDNGLRVVMDVVYNHTAASGQGDKSVLDKVVPGYYYRYTTNGALYTTSCCDDTASEYAMFEKLMIDTLKRWAVDYRVDSFRFDLMNFHTRQNMLDVKAALLAVRPDIYLYGEGWDFGSAADKGLTTCPNCYAKQANMTGTEIGSFNDKIRDAAHGGYSVDDLGIRKQGYINGLSYDWNGYTYSNRDASDLNTAMDILRSALRGSGTDWNGQGQPFTDDPQESVPYVEKHDNETLFDQNVFKLPNGVNGTAVTSMADRVRVQNLGTSVVALAQGVPFFQMGQDILRSKSLDRNSYDSGDWFNRVDWSYTDSDYANNFGVGLPPAWDNQTRWDIMGPHLTNTALDPAPTDAQFSAAQMREMLRIRKSSPLFRLTTEAEINARIGFYNTANNPVGLLVMGMSDTVGADLDANYETILVFFNANKGDPAEFTIAGANGFSLHPIQADATDADPVVQTATFTDATDTFTIPARTTAVFVSAQALTPPVPPSSIDWVGKMYPQGGTKTPEQITENAALGAFNVYVQVYELGITGASGTHTGISCYLHWGKYGDAWSDVLMTRNLGFSHASNDEYVASITQTAMNLLTSGTYGFTAYCQKGGEDKKWKVDNALEGDVGDGLLTVIPAGDPRPAPEGGVFVHLFEWRWADIEKECTYLASKGYTGVQVSPPQEHLVPTADQGDPAFDFPWWVRYQPVSYSLAQSRSGTLAEFQAMVAACNAVGVEIIADAVINHMTGPGDNNTTYTGTAGTPYRGFQYPYPSDALYGPSDFHANVGACSSANGEIQNYADRRQVQNCELSGLSDLNTGSAAVQADIRAYLQSLLDLGVKGFRVDGAKHIAANDLAAILNGLTGDFYVFQEAIDQSTGEAVRDWEYTPNGDVTEFAYPFALGAAFDDACGGSLSDLQTRFSQTDMLPSRFALVFTDNHDNQRGHGVGSGCVVDHRDGPEHVLANIFGLAYPYGDYVSVMSSYYWQELSTTNTGDSMGPPTVNGGPGSSGATLLVHTSADLTPDNCSDDYAFGKWVCEHRRPGVAGMVGFRQATAGEAVTNWQNIGTAPTDHIAFGLGARGFVAINRTASAAAPTYQTGLAAGVYCDVTRGELNAAGDGCTGRTVTVDSSGQISSFSLPALDAFAIHADQKVQAAGDPPQAFLSWTAVGGAASYRIHRAENTPYFNPGGAPLAVRLTPDFYDPAAELDSAATNHFYTIQAYDAAGEPTGALIRRGEFTFGLTPGD